MSFWQLIKEYQDNLRMARSGQEDYEEFRTPAENSFAALEEYIEEHNLSADELKAWEDIYQLKKPCKHCGCRNFYA